MATSFASVSDACPNAQGMECDSRETESQMYMYFMIYLVTQISATISGSRMNDENGDHPSVPRNHEDEKENKDSERRTRKAKTNNI
ncbi:hypothetical protein VNO78_20205 [Psophocarpus tetragonolobus]|uniref:Uncharacterized protein n=1 Tax=Psophocarpus tetragonolobus TaxID=3891 RepID=A0AAN9SAH6_PSOTE